MAALFDKTGVLGENLFLETIFNIFPIFFRLSRIMLQSLVDAVRATMSYFSELLHSAHRACLSDPYNSHRRSGYFPYSISSWSVSRRYSVLTERNELNTRV